MLFRSPGIRNNDAYQTMRFSVAIARARAEVGGYEPDLPDFTSVSAVGRNAMVIGFNDGVDDVIDRALKLEAIKMKMSDDEWGSGFNLDESDEEE